MKKWMVLVCLLWQLTLAQQAAMSAESAADQNFIVEQAFAELSVDEVNQFIHSMNREMDDDLPLLSLDVLQKIIAKGVDFDFQAMADALLHKLFREFLHNASLMGKLLFLAVLCAMLQNLQNSFERPGISALAYSVCFAFLSVIAFHAFYQVMRIGVDAVERMVGFMVALLPLLLTLLAGAGAVTSAALFSPLMLFTVTSVSVVVKDFVLPLLMLGAALECANYLTDQYQLRQLTGLFRQSSMIVLGFIMVLFIGIITIQGVAGSVADGIGLRTAKFATTTFVPVVGKVFSDTVELVMGASLLLKSAVGIFGVLTILSICLLPLIKMFSLVAVMKLTGALIEPMGDAKMAQCLTALGNHLFLVAAAVLTVILMFFLAITMIIGAGSMTMMLR